VVRLAAVLCWWVLLTSWEEGVIPDLLVAQVWKAAKREWLMQEWWAAQLLVG
jgi:hypothetical protein